MGRQKSSRRCPPACGSMRRVLPPARNSSSAFPASLSPIHPGLPGKGQYVPHMELCHLDRLRRPAVRARLRGHPPGDRPDLLGTVARLLAHETAADRAAVARYTAVNEETSRSHRGFFPGAIRDSEDLPGEAGLEDAVGAGSGQLVGTPRQRAGQPQQGSVRCGDDLHVYAMPLVLLAVVRLVGRDPVHGDQGAVNMTKSPSLSPTRASHSPGAWLSGRA